MSTNDILTEFTINAPFGNVKRSKNINGRAGKDRHTAPSHTIAAFLLPYRQMDYDVRASQHAQQP